LPLGSFFWGRFGGGKRNRKDGLLGWKACLVAGWSLAVFLGYGEKRSVDEMAWQAEIVPPVPLFLRERNPSRCPNQLEPASPPARPCPGGLGAVCRLADYYLRREEKKVQGVFDYRQSCNACSTMSMNFVELWDSTVAGPTCPLGQCCFFRCAAAAITKQGPSIQ
jgi:hypothetical protein